MYTHNEEEGEHCRKLAREEAPMPKKRSKKAKKPVSKSNGGLYLRLAGFAAIVVVALGAVFLLLRPAQTAGDPSATKVRVDMAGFQPNAIEAKVGVPVKLRLINPDSPYHTDGEGRHQFAIPELGVDVVVPPESDRLITFTPTAAGSYTFYCDTCCGGKENPSMRGLLTVSA